MLIVVSRDLNKVHASVEEPQSCGENPDIDLLRQALIDTLVDLDLAY
jgi:hypothetical protein